MTRFSDRHGFAATDADIRVRNEAPAELRSVTLAIAEECGLSPRPMRDVLCRVLRRRPDPNNWSERPNIAGECDGLIQNCEWFEVYDIIEALYKTFLDPAFCWHQNGPAGVLEEFAEQLNRYFRKEGIGWQLVGGLVEVRGSESFEATLHEARAQLAAKGRQTAESELHEAITDLSRRPKPDVTGAVQHAMSALECVTRDACGDERATLGELMKRFPDAFPKPLDQAVDKLWGYSSETGRHLREGRLPTFEEAELLVGICGALCRYLTRKME